MSALNFHRCFNATMIEEGSYVNNPNDPGKETKFGISKKQYPDLDIPNLTIVEAERIYRDDYWKRCSCDDLVWPLDLYVFDTAVNLGCDEKASFRTQKLLQHTLGVVEDGIIGPVTLRAAASVAANRNFLARFMTNRLKYYQSLPTYPEFGTGWTIRVLRIVMEGASRISV